MNFPVFVECYADKALIVSLGVPAKMVIDSGGHSEVCKALRRKHNAIGIVDEDPQGTHLGYLKGFKPLFKDDHFQILIYEGTKSYLIVLRPRLEEWILKACTHAQIKIKDYKLPQDAQELHGVINLNLSKFRILLDTLKQKSDLFKQLQNHLKTPQ